MPLATPVLFPDHQAHSALGLILMMPRKLNYEHVGTPVNFTTHTGAIAGNHSMQVYLDALNA